MARPGHAVTNILTPAQTGLQNASLAANPSMSLRVTDYSVASVYVMVNRQTATSVLMDCTSGPTMAVQAAISIAQVNPTSGTIAMVPARWNYPITASGMLRMQVAPLNDTFLYCRFSAPDATGDTITVYTQLGG